MTPSLTFKLLTSSEAIQEISKLWHEVLWKSTCNRAFSSPHWFLATIKVFEKRPFVPVAYRGAQLVGILPLVQNASEVTFGNTDQCDFQDLVVAREDHETGTELLRFALKQMGDSTPLKLGNFTSTSNIFQALRSVQDDLEEIEALQVDSTCPIVDLKVDWETYLSKRKATFRRDVRAAQRRVAANGFQFKNFKEQPQLAAELIDTFFKLHLSRKSDQNVKTRFGTEKLQSFVRLVLPASIEDGSVLVHTLEDGKNVAAISIETVGDSELVGWQNGLNPEFHSLSPGKVLLAEAMQSAMADQYSLYDLGRGLESWKQEWLTGYRKIYALSVCRADSPQS